MHLLFIFFLILKTKIVCSRNLICNFSILDQGQPKCFIRNCCKTSTQRKPLLWDSSEMVLVLEWNPEALLKLIDFYGSCWIYWKEDKYLRIISNKAAPITVLLQWQMLSGFLAQNRRALLIDRAHTCNSDAAKLDNENLPTSTSLNAGVSMACN